MKHKILLSMLTAIVIFAATTSAEASIFGRLSVVWNGCSPCEPAACQPCTPMACEPIACQPCDAACDDFCGPRPFRPFGGLLVNMRARLAAHCNPCGCDVTPCQPCEPSACEPCEACASVCAPRPFGGFLTNLKAKLATARCAPMCEPCEPALCEPCAACR